MQHGELLQEPTPEDKSGVPSLVCAVHFESVPVVSARGRWRVHSCPGSIREEAGGVPHALWGFL